MNQTAQIPGWKQKMEQELVDCLADAQDLLITSFEKMDVLAAQELRRKLRDVKAEYVVVKGSIFKRALKKLGHDGLQASVDGPCGFALGGSDVITVSKVLKEFSESNPQFVIRGGLVENNLLSTEQVKEIADLPAPEVVKAQVLGGMLSPITSFVYCLNGVVNNFVVALSEIAKKKENN